MDVPHADEDLLEPRLDKRFLYPIIRIDLRQKIAPATERGDDVKMGTGRAKEEKGQ